MQLGQLERAGRPLEHQLDRPGAGQRLEPKPRAQLVRANRIAGVAQGEDRRVQELLAGRVQPAVVVEVDPESILRVGEKPVAVAVGSPRGVPAAGDTHRALDIPRRGEAEGHAGGAQPQIALGVRQNEFSDL